MGARNTTACEEGTHKRKAEDQLHVRRLQTRHCRDTKEFTTEFRRLLPRCFDAGMRHAYLLVHILRMSI